jgi:hypothetical protein
VIRFTISPAAETFINGMSEPTEMWTCLKEKFSPENNPALQQIIEREFAEARPQSKEDISSYIERLKDFQVVLKDSPFAITDQHLARKVLATLLAEWRSKLCHLISNKDLTLDAAQHSIHNIQAELTGSGSGLTSTPASTKALTVRGRGGGRGRGRHGNSGGRGAKSRGRSTGTGETEESSDSCPAKNANLRCFHCAMFGHAVANCQIKKDAEKF